MSEIPLIAKMQKLKSTNICKSQGTPTKAAERRNSDSLYTKTQGKTEYVYIRVMESSQQELPGAIAKISFPKSMCWNSDVSYLVDLFVGFLALHGVPFSFAGILSGNFLLVSVIQNRLQSWLIVQSLVLV